MSNFLSNVPKVHDRETYKTIGEKYDISIDHIIVYSYNN